MTATIDPDGAIPVCASDALADGGDGIRFDVSTSEGPAHGFVVRFRGTAQAYLDRCAHVGIELDWERGKFFDRSGLYLMCATHGAIYTPEDGRCAGGPCRGGGLRRIRIEERDGTIRWFPDSYVKPPGPAIPTIKIPIL